MRFMLTGRRMGKTTKMIEWFKEDPANRMIVTFSEQEAHRISKEYGIPQRKVVSARKDALGGRREVRGIDNVDIILAQMFGPEIDLMTATDGSSDV